MHVYTRVYRLSNFPRSFSFNEAIVMLVIRIFINRVNSNNDSDRLTTRDLKDTETIRSMNERMNKLSFDEWFMFYDYA